MNAHQLGRLMDIHDDPCPVGSLRHQAYLTQPSQSLALEATTAYLDVRGSSTYMNVLIH
jgi:hypothetical protein